MNKYNVLPFTYGMYKRYNSCKPNELSPLKIPEYI